MDLLQGFNVEKLTNKRGVNIPEVVKTRPTSGNIGMSDSAAEVLGVSDGDRVFTVNFPDQIAGRNIDFDGAKSVIIVKGIKSTSDLLEEKYERENPLKYSSDDNDVRLEERNAYNAQMRAWVNEQIEASEEAEVSAQGNTLRRNGNYLTFTSLAPWAALDGSEEGTNTYTVKKVVGIAVKEDVAVLVDDSYEADGNEIGFIGFNESFTSTKDVVAQVESIDELTTPAIFLVFDEYNDKQVRGAVDNSEDDGTEDLV